MCLDATRRSGKVAFLGQCGEDRTLRVSLDLIAKGLPLMGIWHYNLNLFSSLLKVTQTSPLLDLLVSYTLPMSEIQQTLEISAFATECEDHPPSMGVTCSVDQHLNILLIIFDDVVLSAGFC